MKHVGRILVGVIIGIFLLNPVASSLAQSQPTIQYDQNVRFEHILVEDGLPNATVLGILQDQDGFMWFTTADGLARYDGSNFTIFRQQVGENSLSNNNTFSLIQTEDGLIWIGTDPGGLNVYDPQTGRFRLYVNDPEDPESIVDNSIWALMEDREGNVWAGTRGGLSRLDRSTGKFTNYLVDSENPRALAGTLVRRIYQDKEGAIWVATGGGLQRYDPETDDFTTYSSDPDDPTTLVHNSVWALYEDKQDNFWIGTSRGLQLMDRSTGKFQLFRFDDTPLSSADRVWSVYEDRMGNLWVTTETHGLNLLDRQTGKFTAFIHNPGDPYSLSNDDVYWVTEDSSGVLWVSSRYGGVNKLSPISQRFGLFRSIPGKPFSLSSSSVYSMLSEPDGILWVGTFGGGLNRIDRKTGVVSYYTNDPDDPDSISSNKIYYIHRDKQGVLWVCTSGGGLNRMDPASGNFNAYEESVENPNVMKTNYLTVIEDGDNGRLWIGTLGYGLVLFDPQKGEMDQVYATVEGDQNSLSEGTVYDLEVDQDGQVWIATARGGLELFDPMTDTFTHHREDPDNPNSILSDTVHAVYLDEANHFVWAATSKGLSGLDLTNGEWHNYTDREGLPNNTIVGIQPGKGKELWVSTGKGISRFNLDTETFTNYDARDGLQGDQFEIAASSLGPDGEIFFGGSTGLTYFYPDQIIQNEYLPKTVFTDFQLFNQSVPVGSEILPKPINKTEKITLDHTQSVFSFKFAALSYQISSKNTFQYMMEGFDDDWSPPLTANQATYTNLSPGKYTFLVRAANNDGKWNDTPASIEIEILPPWWGTWWFRGGAVLLVLLLVASGFHLRFRSIRKVNRELEARVNERTSELLEAQEKLQDANTGLKAQLAENLILEQKLREQAVRDALTGLYNRHHLSEVLPAEISRARRADYTVGFMLIDLDHFKNVNDQYGHAAGDQALVAASRTIDEHTRRSDIACRYGGEEFLVILPEISLEDAAQRGEQLCRDIENLEIEFEGQIIRLTVSIGVAIFPLHGESIDQILLAVDAALYKAKDNGRNQIALSA